MTALPVATVIIPIVRSNPHLAETLATLENFYGAQIEVLVLPNQPETIPYCRVISTGRVGPGEKRDIGAREAKSEILVFLDDDAYPEGNWLFNGLKAFVDPEICAVGGPAITPKEDPFWARVSGAFYISPFGGGNVERYWPGNEKKWVQDWPTVNLFIRKEAFFAVGGFQTDFWPGEDTKLCRDLVVKLGKKILYEPTAIVYHHRRASFLNHLRQVGRYGLHRGFFVKKYPETSRKIAYFVPSLFLAALVVGLVLSPFMSKPLFILMFAYALALSVNAFQVVRFEKSARIALGVIPYTFCSHLYYGFQFLRGSLWTRNLKSTLA